MKNLVITLVVLSLLGSSSLLFAQDNEKESIYRACIDQAIPQTRVGNDIGARQQESFPALVNGRQVHLPSRVLLLVRAGRNDLQARRTVRLGRREIGTVGQELAGGKIPVLDEDPLQIAHGRTAQHEVGVAPFELAPTPAQVLFAHIDTAHEPDLSVADHDLPVVA